MASNDYEIWLRAEVDRLRADLADTQRERDRAHTRIAHALALIGTAQGYVLDRDLLDVLTREITPDAALSAGGGGPAEGDKP